MSDAWQRFNDSERLSTFEFRRIPEGVVMRCTCRLADWRGNPRFAPRPRAVFDTMPSALAWALEHEHGKADIPSKADR